MHFKIKQIIKKIPCAVNNNMLRIIPFKKSKKKKTKKLGS